MAIFDKVRNSTKKVIANAEFIKMDLNNLYKLANSLNAKEIKKFYKYEGDFYFKGKNEELLNYIFTLNAINFGSGLSSTWENKRKYKNSSFKSVALSLRKLAQSKVVLDANFAKNVTEEKVAEIIKLNANFELVKMFTKSLNELGKFIHERYGSYSNLINSFKPKTRANDLVMLLYKNLSCYRDVYRFNNFDVYFLKRAQILVNDLYLAFDGKGYGEIEDVNKLTMFADNLLPHFFRINEILIYNNSLLQKINNGVLIKKGSKEEIEIRAFAVQVVEKLKELLNKKSSNLISAEIDWYIWEKAHDEKYKKIPRHKTKTFFY